MTHEFRNIVASYLQASKNQKKCVIASVVDLDGSSYRRPGVRMLIAEDGNMTGAISGGCIEKDVLLESASVFESGIPKMMTYDGRYRLGCEGVIYILLEIFNPSSEFIHAFSQCLDDRKSFSISSFYNRTLNSDTQLGSIAKISDQKFLLNDLIANKPFDRSKDLVHHQQYSPMFQLVIFGGEYDAAKLTIQAVQLGWQVVLVTTPLDGYTKANFPGSSKVLQASADQLPDNLIDENTAVVMMTHNYAKDLHYLMAIKDSHPLYLGLLGPVRRRNKLLDELMEHIGEIPESFMQVLHGPAGLNIGAETAEEIALSICSEIITIKRNKDANHLNELKGEIHSALTNEQS